MARPTNQERIMQLVHDFGASDWFSDYIVDLAAVRKAIPGAAEAIMDLIEADKLAINNDGTTVLYIPKPHCARPNDVA